MTDADHLNDVLRREHPAAFRTLSPLGRRACFPRGIVFQAAEARGARIDATIGQLTDGAGNALPVPSLGESIERRVAFIERLEALAGTVTGRRVLDLGCGRQALWTRAYARRGATVVGVELDPARCRESRAVLATDPPATGRVLGIVRGNGERLPLASSSVAFVHCAQVLEHVASPLAFLAELRRVLVPGGHAYLTAINRHALRDPHFGVT